MRALFTRILPSGPWRLADILKSCLRKSISPSASIAQPLFSVGYTEHPPLLSPTMQSFWIDRLAADEILIIDGGTGSELQRRGVAMDVNAWSGAAALDHEVLLREIHRDYISAGAEVITANTFGTTRFVLASAGLDDQFGRINRRAMRAAREAREEAAAGPVAIAGSLSCLPPGNDPAAYPGPQTESDHYRELAMLLASEGADLIALEMMEDTVHSAMAMAAALETGLPVWLGVSTRLGDSSDRLVGFDFPDTPMAEPLEALIPMTPAVVNIMHTPPEAVAPALEALRQCWKGPCGVYPELGDFSAPDWQFTRQLAPEEFVAHAMTWVAQGARLLGGCCGTLPKHIRALKEAEDDLRAARRT